MIKLETFCGDNLDSAIKQAMELAKNNPNTIIQFDFNGVTVDLHEGHTKDQIAQYYQTNLSFKHTMSKQQAKASKELDIRLTAEKKALRKLWFDKIVRMPDSLEYLKEKQNSGEYLFLFQAAELAAVCNEEEKELLFGDYSGFQVSIIKKLLISYF